MKPFALALAVALLVHGAALADISASGPLALTGSASVPTAGSIRALTLPAPDVLASAMTTGGGSHFAQLDTRSKAMPIPTGLVFALIALFILGMRLMGVRQAHAMAEHERHSHHGRAKMFHSLHEERSRRDQQSQD